LVVLAGLPHPNCSAVAAAVEKALSPPPRVIFQPSGTDNKELYRPQTRTALLRSLSDYATRQLKAHTPAPAPTQIVLAYVPSSDEEHLLEHFDFFVFPIRLTRLGAYDQCGRQYRHDPNEAVRHTVSSVRTGLRSFMEIKRRLSSSSWREPLFLPPRNFKVSDDEQMADIFVGMRRATRAWGDQPPNIRTTTVTGEQLRHIPRGKQREVFSDCRGLLFPPDPQYHGPFRDLAPDCSDEDRKQLMRSSFRFGVPLINGYHHDVQFGDGRGLGGEMFQCSRMGVIQLRCSHANVYPNDYVRPSEK
jgi:hypothetical protein